jgi:thiol-disulfide isomerase/thioredoxin
MSQEDTTKAGATRRRWTLVAVVAVGVAAAALLLAQALRGSPSRQPREAAVAPAGPGAGAQRPLTPEEAQAAENRLLDETAFTHPVDVPAPDVTVVDADGKPIRLSALRGQVLFVNFWATWCPPCVQEMPSMLQLGRALAAAHPGRFKMVAVSGDDGWEPVHAYFKQAFGGAPKELLLARDTDAAAAKGFYCSARGYCPPVKFPETYIVDRSGRVVAMIVGPRDWGDAGFRQWLEFVIAG